MMRWEYRIWSSPTRRLRDATASVGGEALTRGDALIRATTIALGVRDANFALIRVYRLTGGPGRVSRQVQFSAALQVAGSDA